MYKCKDCDIHRIMETPEMGSHLACRKSWSAQSLRDKQGGLSWTEETMRTRAQG